MKAILDDWSTCNPDSGFELNLQVVPHQGETLILHKDLIHPRFFQEEPYLSLPLEVSENGYVSAVVRTVQHLISINQTQVVHLDLEFERR